MKTHFFAFTLLATFLATNAFAQVEEEHSDVEFGYNNLMNPTELEVEVGEATATGVPIFEGEFESFDPINDPGNLSAEDPGFATSPGENLLINAGDQIFLNVLDASSDAVFGGLGYVTFYNFNSEQFEASGRIAVQGNSPTFEDLVLNGDSIESGSLTQFVAAGQTDITTGELAEFDEHIVFDLLDEANTPRGAFGILAQLQSNFAGTGVDEFELTSDPFWIILNNGLTETQFENVAVAAFETAAIPEPGSISLLLMGSVSMLLRRRR